MHHGFQGSSLLTQLLGTGRIIPYRRLTQLKLYLGKCFFFNIIVKGTP
jgi:hypothetical protein